MTAVYQQSWVLIFQTLFAVWQFVRDAKFFRIPYIALSSTWHRGLGYSFDTRRRSVYRLLEKESYEVQTFAAKELEFQTVPTANTVEAPGMSKVVDVGTGLIFSKLSSEVEKANWLELWRRENILRHDFDTLLLPGLILCRVADEDYLLNVDVLRYGLYSVSTACFVDQSTSDYLNDNFLRLLSILPLFLQAKGLPLLSFVATSVIILLDQLSHPANYAWRKAKSFMFRVVKLALATISQRSTREFLHTFLSTISLSLDCSDKLLYKSYYKWTSEVVLSCGSAGAIFLDGYTVSVLALDPYDAPLLPELLDFPLYGSDKLTLDISNTRLLGMGTITLHECQLKINGDHKYSSWRNEEELRKYISVLMYIVKSGQLPITSMRDDEAHCASLYDLSQIFDYELVKVSFPERRLVFFS